jgi:hypothetical protein
MATVLLDMVISLDGLICGPGGADGGLHDWYVDPSEVSRPVPAPQGAGRGPGSSTLRTSHICTTASTVPRDEENRFAASWLCSEPPVLDAHSAGDQFAARRGARFNDESWAAQEVNSDLIAFAQLTFACSTESVNGVPGQRVPGPVNLPAPAGPEGTFGQAGDPGAIGVPARSAGIGAGRSR